MFLTTLLMILFSLCKCVFDRQNFLPNIFSITANLLLYIAAIIMMFKKSFHKRNQGKKKKRHRCKSSSLGKDLFILWTPRLLDIEFLRSDLFFFFLTLHSSLPCIWLKSSHKKNPRRQASQITKKKSPQIHELLGFWLADPTRKRRRRSAETNEGGRVARRVGGERGGERSAEPGQEWRVTRGVARCARPPTCPPRRVFDEYLTYTLWA